MNNKIKSHFVGRWGDLTGYSVIYILVITFVTLFLGLNKYEKWTCDNYEIVTGRESKWIDYDVCYVKTDSGKWIRYDINFKE